MGQATRDPTLRPDWCIRPAREFTNSGAQRVASLLCTKHSRCSGNDQLRTLAYGVSLAIEASGGTLGMPA